MSLQDQVTQWLEKQSNVLKDLPRSELIKRAVDLNEALVAGTPLSDVPGWPVPATV